MKKIELFAGGGGGILAGKLLGHKTVFAAEWEPDYQTVLQARVEDGSLPPFDLHGDVTTLSVSHLRGKVDLVCGGFPCNDISSTGKGKGLTGPASRHVWEMIRLCTECQTPFIFAENSDRLRVKGLELIIQELMNRGYCRIAWATVGAAHVGAPHLRKRMWILAHLGGISANLPEGPLAANGVISGGVYSTLKPMPTVRPAVPTLLRSDASSSGNRPSPSAWSLSDVLGVTAKAGRHGKMYPTPVRSDYKGHSGAGMERLMKLRSRPLRDVLPYEEGRTCLHPEWAEWLMGWPTGWTDITAPCTGLKSWEKTTAAGEWWTDATEVPLLPRTLDKRPPDYVRRIQVLGNGQVPLCAAVTFDHLRNLVR